MSPTQHPMATEILDSRCRQDGPDVSWSASHAAASTSPERYAVMGQFGSPRVLNPKTRKTANMGAESHQRYCVPAWVVFQGLWATMAAAQATNQTTSSRLHCTARYSSGPDQRHPEPWSRPACPFMWRRLTQACW